MDGLKLGKSRKQAAVHARITELEYKSLELMAGQERRNLSDMIRALIVEGARRRAILPSEDDLLREGIPLE